MKAQNQWQKKKYDQLKKALNLRVEEESKTTDEISDPTGTVESTMTTEVNPNVLGNLIKDGNPLSGTSINIYQSGRR